MADENINIGSKIGRYVIEKTLSTKGGTASVHLGHVEHRPKFKVAINFA